MPKIYYDGQGYPIYDPDDGWKNHDEFEAAALNDMAKTAAKGKKEITVNTPQGPIKTIEGSQESEPQDQPESETPKSSLYNYGGRFIPGALPALGGAIGEAVAPEAVVGGGIAGAGLGSAASLALQQKYPQYFGDAPKSNIGKAANLGIDTLTQGYLPGAMENLVKKGIAGTIASSLFKNRGGQALLSKFYKGNTDELLDKLSPKLAETIRDIVNKTADATKEKSSMAVNALEGAYRSLLGLYMSAPKDQTSSASPDQASPQQ